MIKKAIYIVAAFGIVMSLPQLFQIWVEKEAAGVSALSWGAYTLTSIFWLWYGGMQRDLPVILSSGMWVFLSSMIMIGAILY